MRKLFKEDLQDLKFDGIIVGVPIIENIKEGQHDDISFIVECNYYTNGKHGYEEPGYGADNSSFYHVAYNMNCLPNGLWINATSRFTIEHSFRFDSYDYYKFDDMEEFCIWFLQRSKYEIWSTSGDLKGQIHEIEPRKETTAKMSTWKKIKEDKQWIHEKCGTNTPPISVPEKPSIGNKKKDKDSYELTDEYKNCEDIFDMVNKLNIPETQKIYIYTYLRNQRKYFDKLINTQEEIFNDLFKNIKINDEKTKSESNTIKRVDIMKDVIHYVDLRFKLEGLGKQLSDPYKAEYVQDDILKIVKELDDWLQEEVNETRI